MAGREYAIPGPGVLVLGVGASGLAAARFLAGIGRRVLAADSRPESEIPAAAASLSGWGVPLRAGGHPPVLLEGMALVVASPGVPRKTPVLRAARAAGVPVWGELELGYRALGEPAERIAAVTGTKGKSSVVTLLGEALRRHGVSARTCGNLGTPLTALVGDFGPRQVAVVEASSFQLATISRFRARVGVMLAVGEDHLDWHSDLADYRSSKARLFENQTAADWAVFDGADPVAAAIAAAAARESGARRLPFGGAPGTADPEVVVEQGFLVRRHSPEVERLAGLSSLRVPGAHQRRNLAAAAAAASVFGASREAIEAAARSFVGLPHALEERGVVGGVRFLDDSRATSLAATAAALAVVAESASSGSSAARVQLILGGILKGGRFEDLAPRLGPVAGVWAIGQTRRQIAAALPEVPVTICSGLEDAVDRAFAAARPGGVVLLSPGCSSFDLFRDYRDRGERFGARVDALAAAHREDSG